MSKINNIKFLGAAIVTLLAPCTLSAQSESDVNTPAAIERIERENLHFSNSENVSSIQLDNIDYYSRVGFKYSTEEGTFKRVQSGKDNSGYSFYTDGGGKIEKMANAYMWGSFSYSRTKVRDAQYNATLYDPLRGTPFYLADATESDWINQQFDMSVKAASPLLWNRVLLGVEIDYLNGQAAKQIDPRPLTTLSKFVVKPGITVKISDNHAVGGYYAYHSRREDGSATNVNYMFYPTAYIMSFPGFFLETQITSIGSDNLRIYNANMMGGGLEYSYTSEQFNLLLRGNYSQEVEDVSNSYTDPQMVGTTIDEKYSVGLNAGYNFSQKSSLYLDAEYGERSIDGIHYVQQRDNDSEVSKWIIVSKGVRSNSTTNGFNAKLQYMRNSEGKGYNYTAGVRFATESIENTYYLPLSTQQIKNSYFGLFARKNFVLNNKNSILLGIDYGMKFNGSSENNYTGQNADTECYKEFTLKDFNYLSSDYTSFGADVTYSLFNLVKGVGSMFLSLDIDWYGASSNKEIFNDRMFMNFSVGITF